MYLSHEESMFNNCDMVREAFLEKYLQKDFIADKSGCKILELMGLSFIADEDHIFGEPNLDYIDRELKWYKSMSRSVNDIPGKVPEIWKQVADRNGHINSNYGWCLDSPENFNQFDNVVNALVNKPDTRQAIAIYTRPNMHFDAFAHGRSDFMCTNAHQYLIRNNKLHAVVQMRSNDVTFGYRNDLAWAKNAQGDVYNAVVSSFSKMGSDIELSLGSIFWQVGSLHIYERDFYLVDHYANTGETNITKKEYDKLQDVG